MIDYPGGQRIRAVTHYGIEAADIDAAIDATRRALADGRPGADRLDCSRRRRCLTRRTRHRATRARRILPRRRPTSASTR